MKIILRNCLFTLFSLFAISVQSQLFVSVGPQIGYMNMKEANLPVDFFNDKGFLFKQQKKFHWPNGLIYAASYRGDGFVAELALNSKRHRASAEAGSGTSIERRDHRFAIQSLSVTAGLAAIDQSDMLMYLCMSIDLGYLRYSSRYGLKTNIGRANYATYRRENFLGTTLSMRFVFRESEEDLFTWSLSPYIQIPFKKFNFREFNQVLNPYDYQQVGIDLLARPLNFGLSLTMDLDLIGVLD